MRFQAHSLFATVLALLILALAAPGASEEQAEPLPELGVNHQTGEPLRVGGGKKLLNDLGPIIVGEGGDVKRISDWKELTPEEQALARERIRKRNEERLEKLRDKAREEDRHDSTLVFEDDAEQARKSTSDLNFERRKQLTGFVDTLNKLKESSGGKDLPGFDNSFLKDPRLPNNKEVDLNVLKAQIEKLQQARDKHTGKDKMNVHEDL